MTAEAVRTATSVAAEEHPAPRVTRLRREAHVLAHAKRRKDVAALEGARDPLLRHAVHRQTGDLLAGKEHLARVRLERTGDEVEHGRLSRAVRADHRADLARLDRETHPVNGHEGAEAAHQAAAFKQRHFS
jgi:hypothetical protein